MSTKTSNCLEAEDIFEKENKTFGFLNALNVQIPKNFLTLRRICWHCKAGILVS